jgi:PQQ-dependent dehydrogenase (methanol/ethanol family)
MPRFWLMCVLGLVACVGTSQLVDDARLRRAATEPGSWLAHGRTWAEQRYSPLARIDTSNVGQLGLVWSFDMQTTRGVEATPIVADGVMYVSGPWSVVYALDARTGALRWKHDPQVPGSWARHLCCGVINRGVALYRGRVYVGTLDGRLVALDAETGAVRWEVRTTDPSEPYSITGAPRVLDGKVVIGNGGADIGVRGYVSAYDAATGELVWRTYTVPGDPSQPFESPALEAAAATWSGEWWKFGGGGTAWDAMAYDPELDLLYVGTGNGTPHAREWRSPGGGDNLYLSSILALRPSDGELVWHFQTTPADNWDYTATQHILLADLEIEGQLRKVLMQAPKNGFFWVIDRETGAFISAAPFVEVTWATGVDATGRAIENPATDYREAGRLVKPGPFGGHNWHPMSYSPRTGLVYLPTQEMESLYEIDRDWTFDPGVLNTGLAASLIVNVEAGAEVDVSGALVAWDPVAQREVWRVEQRNPWNGGTLATAGGLVFQGTADGRFVAYRATDGEPLWESPAGTGVMAAPVTWELDGVQYVTVAAGWGSGYATSGGPAAERAGVQGGGQVLSFALGGNQPVPQAAEPARFAPPPLPDGIPAADLERGNVLFHKECVACHGMLAIGGGSISDLRFARPEVHASFQEIVLGGTRAARGMPSFADRLTPEEVDLIHHYILARAHTAD